MKWFDQLLAYFKLRRISNDTVTVRLVLMPIGDKAYKVEVMKPDEWPKGSTIDEGMVIRLGNGGTISIEV